MIALQSENNVILTLNYSNVKLLKILQSHQYF